MGQVGGGTYSDCESSLSETAGTVLSGGNSAGLTAERPLWITSITYLRDKRVIVRSHSFPQRIERAPLHPGW